MKTCIIFQIYFENFTSTAPSIFPPSIQKCMPAHSSICLCYQCYQSTMLAVSSAHGMPNEVLIDEHTHASVWAGLYLTHERLHSFALRCKAGGGTNWEVCPDDIKALHRRQQAQTQCTTRQKQFDERRLHHLAHLMKYGRWWSRLNV